MNSSKTSIHLKILCIAAYCGFLTFKVFAQDFKFNNHRKVQNISFDFIKSLIIIPIYINEKGPFDFILDTGVNPVIVTEPTLKESLNVPYLRNIKISGYGNFKGIDAYLSATHVKIGEAEAAHIPTVFLKDDVLPISGFLGKKIYGLIGYNFFNSFIVKVDYTNKTLKFSSLAKKIKLKGERVPLELIENKPYIVISVDQEPLGNQKLKALVDCGASHTISLEALDAKPFPQPAFTMEANLGNGLTGSLRGRMGRIKSLKIGGFKFSEVLSNYPAYNIDSIKNKSRNANLGAEILSRFNTIYDYQNRCMYLKKNERFNRPFEHDMSGIELYSDSSTPSRIIVNRIEPESPADLVGLRQGDEIISINFKKIDDYTLDELGEVFKAKNGYSVIVEVWRDKSFLVKLLKLKKRI